MRKKIIIIAIVVVAIIVLIAMNFSTERVNNVENIEQNLEEIQPEEEMPANENTQTRISLYYLDKTSGVLTKEERNVDAKELIDVPYKYTLEELFKGPEDSKLSNPIPQNTKINSVDVKNGVLTIDLSKEFLNSTGMDSIYSIVNTMTEFNEINGVKFKIDGEIKDNLKEIYVKK